MAPFTSRQGPSCVFQTEMEAVDKSALVDAECTPTGPDALSASHMNGTAAAGDEDQMLDDNGQPIPRWQEQITIRAIVVSAVLGFVFNVMVLKLGFTVGIIPSLNIAAGLLGYALTRGWAATVAATPCLRRILGAKPFTRQENTVIQTCIVACYGLAFSGGFTNWLTAMDWNSYAQVDGSAAGAMVGHPPAVLPSSVVQPQFWRLVALMALIYFIGILALVPLRQIFIIKYRLVFPSGTATGTVINGFFLPLGQQEAKAQVSSLVKWGAASFGFSAFKWFFSGFGDGCGFDQFPSLGFAAFHWKWYFDFSQVYVAVGFLCPYFVTYSIMVGAVLSYGIIWPLINTRAGVWFPAEYGQGTSAIQGISGYKVFITVALILGDGLYNLVKLSIMIAADLRRRWRKGGDQLPVTSAVHDAHSEGLVSVRMSMPAAQSAGMNDVPAPAPHGEGPHPPSPAAESAAAWRAGEAGAHMGGEQAPGADDAYHRAEPGDGDGALGAGRAEAVQALRDAVFLRDAIPNWVAIVGYIALAVISIGTVPTLFPKGVVKWYYVAVAYLVAPIFAFCNAYGAGLTDWNMLTTYGKVAIFVFAAWGGPQGGIVAGLALCGVMCTITGAAADLMQDFRTGYLTASSPRAMFAAQLIGAALACFLSPAAFWLYWRSFVIGDPHGQYKAPFASLFRSMAVLGVQGPSILPKNCLVMCAGAFAFAVLLNLLRDHGVPKRFQAYVPVPMAMAIPVYMGGYFGVDMAIGALALWLWELTDKKSAAAFGPIVASALIAGDGLWTVPAAVLALAKRSPPICMWFFSTADFQAHYSGLPQY